MHVLNRLRRLGRRSLPYEYQIVAEQILERIRSREWRRGSKLPPLNELERQFPQSRMTLYKALRDLTDRGYLSMTRGRGTFVRETRERRRVAIVVPEAVAWQGAPFAFQAFRLAHQWLHDIGIDSQLYAEDTLNPYHLPRGFIEDFERKKIAGILSIDAPASIGFMSTPLWRKAPIPHVTIGARPAERRVYVDSSHFVDRAIRLAAARGKVRPALLERGEHLVAHLGAFNNRCAALRITPCQLPMDDMPADSLGYEEYGYELLRRYWRSAEKPDVVVVPDDVIAKGVSQAALTLPENDARELLIIAMTNRGSEFFYPVPVVKMEVDVAEVALTAAKQLRALMEGKHVPAGTVLVRPRLHRITRDKSSPPTAATADEPTHA